MTHTTRIPRPSYSRRPITAPQARYLRALVMRGGAGALAAAKTTLEIDTPGIDKLTVSQAARLIQYLLNVREGSK